MIFDIFDIVDCFCWKYSGSYLFQQCTSLFHFMTSRSCRFYQYRVSYSAHVVSTPSFLVHATNDYRRGEPVPVQHDYAKFDPRTQHHPPAIAAHDYRVPDRVDGGTAVAPPSVGSISGVASTGVAMGGGGRPVVNDYRVAHHHPAVDTRHPPSAVRGFDYRVRAEEIPGHSVASSLSFSSCRAGHDATLSLFKHFFTHTHTHTHTHTRARAYARTHEFFYALFPLPLFIPQCL